MCVQNPPQLTGNLDNARHLVSCEPHDTVVHTLCGLTFERRPDPDSYPPCGRCRTIVEHDLDRARRQLAKHIRRANADIDLLVEAIDSLTPEPADGRTNDDR